MNIKQLESFVCIVECGSFAAAAERLFATQSTISSRIQELEKHLGVQLFDRSHHRATLTPKGEQLLPFARQVVFLAQQATHEIGDKEAISGVLRIGAVGLVAITLLPRLVEAVRATYPNLILRLHIHLTHTVFQKLHAGAIDLALVTSPVTEPDVETYFLSSDEFVWMASPGLDLPEGALTPRDLQRWPILGFTQDSHHYPVIQRWFDSDGSIYAPVVSTNNMNLIAELTVAGAGVSLLPRRCYDRLVDQGLLRVIKTRPKLPLVEFVAAHKRNAQPQPLVRAIAAMAADLVNERTVGGED